MHVPQALGLLGIDLAEPLGLLATFALPPLLAPSPQAHGNRSRRQIRGHVALRCECLQHEHGVGDRNVLEVVLAPLERLEHRLDRLDVADDVLGGDHRQRVTHVTREVVADADRVGVDSRVLPVAEDGAGERRRVAADRRLRLGSTLGERPAGRLLGPRPVAGQHERLHRADRPTPAPGRSVGVALAPARGREHEPRPGIAAVHQQAEPGPPGGVSHPRQLPLPLVAGPRRAAPPRPGNAGSRARTALPSRPSGKYRGSAPPRLAAPRPSRYASQSDARRGLGRLLRTSAAHVAAPMQETIAQSLTAPEETRSLVAAAERAAVWAGEPFLHPDEDPGQVLTPGHRAPPRARRRDLSEIDAGRDGALARMEDPLRADARTRAGPEREAAAPEVRHRAAPSPGGRARRDADRADRGRAAPA